MKEIYDLLSEFKTLKEYSEFLDTLVEKSASGSEISRGMNKHDKSKDQKKDDVKTYKSKEVQKKADGSAVETHYSQNDASLEQVPEPPPEPPVPLEPGQQVVIGNKQIDKAKTAPSTVKIDLSGEQEKIETKPRLTKNPKTPAQ